MEPKSAGAMKYKVLAAALMLGAIGSQAALAHGPYRGGPQVSIGVGFGFGAPFAPYPFYHPYAYSPFYYPPTYYAPAYYPPVVLAPAVPPVYVEQPQVLQSVPVQPPALLNPQEASPQPGTMWYYCNEARAYYPYVKSCPAGWQQVTPQPQG